MQFVSKLSGDMPFDLLSHTCNARAKILNFMEWLI